MVATRKSKNSGPTRGGVAKRRTATRTDRDGDLVMDSSSRGRGGITKSRPAPAEKGAGAKTARDSANAARIQRDLLRHVSGGDAAVRAPRHATKGPLDEIRISKWRGSKASNSDDGGVTSLITWLERKATVKTPGKRPVKVKKSRVEGDDLIISVPAEDVGAVIRLNGWVFAGTNVQIQRASVQESGESGGAQSTRDMFKRVLERRYNPDTRLLDLSALGQDPDLKASQIFDSRSTTSKFFPALMKVLDSQFKSTKEKHDAIQSVTLANNDLLDIAAVTTLAPTLPGIKNLDLSNNSFPNLAAIETWKRRFPGLDHLVISNNPLEQAEPNFAKELTTWYPKLRLLNSVQVRSDEEAAKGIQVVDLPFPVRTPSFQDEGQIAENFIRTFFAGFDSDRPALANHFYDDRSDFSFAVDTKAPRDPSSDGSQDWDTYLKQSRNLKRIHHPPARQSRHSRGAQAVSEAWALFPPTRHPDLAAEPKKWLIECQLQPGLPDPTGQSPGGVDGFLITLHGEYDELDLSTGQSRKKRSFDRTFIIGPGGPAGVRVVNDMLTVRPYGGTQAFEPDSKDNTVEAGVGSGTTEHSSAQPLPELTPEMAEQMVVELQKQTGMTIAYAKDCLEQVQWDFPRAVQAFASVRGNLPPEAFAQI